MIPTVRSAAVARALRHVAAVRTDTVCLALAGLALMGWSADAAAQYRWKGPNGEIVFSDQPPPDAGRGGAREPAVQRVGNVPSAGAAAARAGGAGAGGATGAGPTGTGTGAAGTSGALPYALQRIASRQPVTLYTIEHCAPCQSARMFLAARGIPYAEKTVSTEDDVKAMAALGNTDARYPSLSVGTARQSGFESGAWARALDQAGYPATSQLPKGWTAPVGALTRPALAASAGGPAAGGTAAAGADAAGHAAGAAGGASAGPANARPAATLDTPAAPRGPEPAIRF